MGGRDEADVVGMPNNAANNANNNNGPSTGVGGTNEAGGAAGRSGVRGGGEYMILEENLRQLQGIRETVQQMRTSRAQPFQLPADLQRGPYSRLSCSCPSLFEEGEADLLLMGVVDGEDYLGIDMGIEDAGEIEDEIEDDDEMSPDVSDAPSVWLQAPNSSPPSQGPNQTREAGTDLLLWPQAGDGGEPERRRSWSVTAPKKTNGQIHGEPKVEVSEDSSGPQRQRSVSLSSLGVEESAVTETLKPPQTEMMPKLLSGLNSASASNFPPPSPSPPSSSSSSSRLLLLSPRLPLHKSVSTPSIVAKDSPNDDNNNASGAVQVLPPSSVALPTPESAPDKEEDDDDDDEDEDEEEEEEEYDDEEDSAGRLTKTSSASFSSMLFLGGGSGGGEKPKKSMSSSSSQSKGLFSKQLHHRNTLPASLSGLRDLWQDPAFQEEDPHSGGSKRRKRGSLFFRKKKEKEAKPKRPHQFLSVSFGNNALCGVCSRSLSTGGAKGAVRCESCHLAVHEGTCKEHVPECTRFRIPRIMSRPSISTSSSTLSAGGKSLSVGSADVASQSKGPSDERETTDEPNGVAPEDSASTVVTPEIGDDLSAPSHPSPSSSAEPSPLLPEVEWDDPVLGLQEEEMECWAQTVDRKVVKRLKEREVKRQEHMYELIMTEKHHCLVLALVQRVFASGMRRHLGLDQADVERLFPCLPDLLDLHMGFLRKLRQRQREQQPVLQSLADLLLEQFGGQGAQRMEVAYGEFCSKHQEALQLYKELERTDRRFAQFVRLCAAHPQLKKKGLPECVLFVTQRITKYPLLLEPLLKASKDIRPQEAPHLAQALDSLKAVVRAVDARVEQHQRRQRQIHIYHRLDPKSSALFRTRKFKKSDVLAQHRTLRFEGSANLAPSHSHGHHHHRESHYSSHSSHSSQQRHKMTHVVVLSDLLFFLQDAGGKMHFLQIDGKPAALPLQQLLVREKAGQNNTGLYLISNPAAPDPIMYELEVLNPKERHVWIQAIREAVDNCPVETEDGGGNPEDEDDEEARRLLMERSEKARNLTQAMQTKDAQLATLLEEKMRLSLELLALEQSGNAAEAPSYATLLGEEGPAMAPRQELMTAAQEAARLALTMAARVQAPDADAAAANLSRSASSVGEHQSATYVSPLLPRRAETFGGFDAQLANLQHLQVDSQQPEGQDGRREAGLQLAHCLHWFLIVLSQQATAVEQSRVQLQEGMRRLQLAERRAGLSGSGASDGVYSHTLEELRNLQDKFSQEKSGWIRRRDQEERDLTEERTRLAALQERVKAEQDDVKEQREMLYRKLEALRAQGILVGPTNTIVAPAPDPEEIPLPPQPRKAPPAVPPPVHLVSATNQHKAAIPAVRQQLPLKLAAGGLAQPATTQPQAKKVQQLLPLRLSEGSKAELPGSLGAGPNASALVAAPPPVLLTAPYHQRTGSSPALMGPSSPPPVANPGPSSGRGAQRTHTYPKLPQRPSPAASQNPKRQDASEQEIFFF